jgi:hypothetical protein
MAKRVENKYGPEPGDEVAPVVAEPALPKDDR